MTDALTSVLDSLSEIQREATFFNEGSALILAGPGAGKTRVLTSRIARLLVESEKKNFRILALTFTTKAAKEMRERIDQMVPDAGDRLFVGTFHAFCTQLLRQHGSHLGSTPDFDILDQYADREAILSDALIEAAQSGEPVSADDVRWLDSIDQLKSRLITPDKAAARFKDPQSGKTAALVYEIYEEALRRNNSTDFNGLILNVCRLLRDVPGVAERVRRTYRYWLVDEFQDTSPAQYRLLQLAAGSDFKNVFAVADDDQIIYQWAGASYRQIERFREEFKPTLIQLVENHRCPPDIVAAANRLVAHNTFRTAEKSAIVATKQSQGPSIELLCFGTDAEEQAAIAASLKAKGETTWGETVILARTRSLLVPIQNALANAGVKATLSERRDRFISPEFTWLQACLDQAVRPNDLRTFRAMVDAGNRVTNEDLDADIMIAEASAAGSSFLHLWANAMSASRNELSRQLGDLTHCLEESRKFWKTLVKQAIPILLQREQSGEGITSDAEDDRSAWDACLREIRAESGGDPDLDEVLQGLALRSKEPPRDPGSVTLMTIHASKGLEFDNVWVAGLAEEVIPSWQSLKKGPTSPEMEEERRNCFVAITRTRSKLTLSRAAQYRGWNKPPSRFLQEMGLIQ